MTDRQDTATVHPAEPPSDARGPAARHPGMRPSRRGWTLICSMILVLAFGLLGSFVRVPYVALGPGPTYDTLGAVDGTQVIEISGAESYPTGGELRLTTVSVNPELTLFGAMGFWMSGRYALAPRELYFPPGKSPEDVQRQSAEQFQHSQSAAEVAALHQLGYPVKVIISEVVAGSPADGVLSPGAELLAINGHEVTTVDDVMAAMRPTRPGDTISITARPEGEAERTESITLARSPEGPQGFIGIAPMLRAEADVDIEINLSDVGGPSAGLIFALAIVDELTPGQLVAGRKVAGTGEIAPDGEVGPIGGISFKVVGARESGVTVYLVPEQNCAEAAAAAPDGMRLVKVSTLGDAIAALEDIRAGRRAPSC